MAGNYDKEVTPTGSDDVGDKCYSVDGPHDEEVGVVQSGHQLQRDLKGRHMQMIAIGTSCLPALLLCL